MNHAGEITPLTKLVKPHVAIVTTVAPAHLEFFDSVADIAMAKAEIFSGLRKGGTAILPRDNEHFDLLAKQVTEKSQYGQGITITTFGRSEGSDLRMLDYTAVAGGQGEITAEIFGARRQFRIGLAGEHQAMNALAVLAGVHAVGADLDQAIEALGTHSAVGGRGKPVALDLDGRKVTLLDESYNANPASMKAAIGVLGGWQGAAKIAVLGEMRELGSDAGALHLALAPLLEEAGIDRVYAAGAMMKPVLEKLPGQMQGGWAESAADLVDKVAEELEDGAILMAKGSNASRVSAFVEGLVRRAAPGAPSTGGGAPAQD